MADILFDFPIAAPAARVFEAVSTPAGLDAWWTGRSKGTARLGAPFELWFPPDFDWRARVSACEPGVRFELEMTQADADWKGTHVGFEKKEAAPMRNGASFRRSVTGVPT